jgi:signal peptidase I
MVMTPGTPGANPAIPADSGSLSGTGAGIQPSSIAASGVLLRDLSADLLGCGYDVRFRATGRSMHPAIREGETITVRPVLPSTIRRGDIILYRWQQGVIAHRVIGIAKAAGGDFRLLTRGDAAGAQVEPVAPDQVLGKVVAAERNGRRVNLYGIRSKVQRILHPLASRCKQCVLLHIKRYYFK